MSEASAMTFWRAALLSLLRIGWPARVRGGYCELTGAVCVTNRTDNLMPVLPNTRLKLTPPAICGKLSFVKSKARRRSLAAIR